MTSKWRYSEESLDGTHHVDKSGKLLYSARFRQVLPFHNPGLAPVVDETGAYHIGGDGYPAYSERYSRTFGFYQRIATVADGNRWFHILEDGSRLYNCDWAWCGNFQNDRCPIRDEDGLYYHIRTDGTVVPNGPWAYAGDFREASAVVRGKDGLCRHVDPEGNFIHDKEFFDLDVYHKGFARARDGDGWFHIDRNGEDISFRRYEYLEPFYNGQALTRTKDGSIEIINESGEKIKEIQPSWAEMAERLHNIAVSYWIPMTIKTGLDSGIADKNRSSDLDGIELKAIESAWAELGLFDKKSHSLTSLGKMLKKGTVTRDRFDFWLGPQLKPWIMVIKSGILIKGGDFFEEISSDEKIVRLTQRVLDSYAKTDWKGITKEIDLSQCKTVVDLCGGMGALLEEVIRTSPAGKGILFERQEVIGLLNRKENIDTVGGDIFTDDLPKGDIYILSRVLHDWDDVKAIKMLKNIGRSVGRSRLLIIERIVSENRKHGLLNLNMFIATGGQERTSEEWEVLFNESGWELLDKKSFNDHFIMELNLGGNKNEL